MNQTLYEKGLKTRREVLGDAYVDRALSQADDFSMPFQELATACGWGAVWSREGLSRRSRSLVTVAMVTALNRPHELKVHLRGALRNGCTPVEIREVLMQAAIYAGMPAALDAFAIAGEVIKQFEEESDAIT